MVGASENPRVSAMSVFAYRTARGSLPGDVSNRRHLPAFRSSHPLLALTRAPMPSPLLCSFIGKGSAGDCGGISVKPS